MYAFNFSLFYGCLALTVCYNNFRSVETKVKAAKSVIAEQRKMTKELNTALSNAQTLTEVECLVCILICISAIYSYIIVK